MRPTALPLRACLLLTVAISVTSIALPASACSPPLPVPGYIDLGATIPSDGATNVPLDAALAVDLLRYGGPDYSSADATLTDGVTGEAVPGEVGKYYWDRGFLRFKPTAVLAPNHLYRFEAVVTSSVARVDSAIGAEHISITFTTGEAASPPLEVVGKMQIELEVEEAPDYSTCSPGMCSCSPTSTVIDMKAQVTLPAAKGGQPGGGYWALVMVTSTEPYVFSDPPNSGVLVHANGTSAVTTESGTAITIGRLSRAASYSPCFSVQVRDLAGNLATGESLCLIGETVPPVTKSGAGGAPTGTAGSAGNANMLGIAGTPAESSNLGGATLDAVRAPSNPTARGGCTVTSTVPTGAWWSFFGLLGIFGLLRRVVHSSTSSHKP